MSGWFLTGRRGDKSETFFAGTGMTSGRETSSVTMAPEPFGRGSIWVERCRSLLAEGDSGQRGHPGVLEASEGTGKMRLHQCL